MKQKDYFYDQLDDDENDPPYDPWADPTPLPWGALPFEEPPASDEDIPPPTDADCPPERENDTFDLEEYYRRPLEGFSYDNPLAGTPFEEVPPLRKGPYVPENATQTDAFQSARPTQTDAFQSARPTQTDAFTAASATQTDAFTAASATQTDAFAPPPSAPPTNSIEDITQHCAAHMPSACIGFNPKARVAVVDEWAFVKWLSVFASVRCINYQFYLFGVKVAESMLKRMMLEIVRDHAEVSASKLTSMVGLLENFTTCAAPAVKADAIAFANKTLVLHQAEGADCASITLRMKPPTDFLLCRVPHAFDPTVGEPTRLLAFLNGLFAPEDLPTVQEYLGYCLLPSTRAQKALFIIGKGGEGKSRLSVLMKLVLGDAAVVSSVAKISERFFPCMLENRLLFIDDDLQTAKFAATDAFKSLVTSETNIMVEQKGKMHYEMRPYARFLLMGNQSVGSLHDKSHGFYRRVHIIHTLPAPSDRVNNPTLIQDIWAAEQAEILLWLVKGALRLARQNYQLTESEASRAALTALKEEDNTALSFLKEQNFTYGAHCSVTSSVLSTKYKDWCLDNDLFRVGGQAFKQTCEAFFAKHGARYDKNVSTALGRVRGYTGVAFSGQ